MDPASPINSAATEPSYGTAQVANVAAAVRDLGHPTQVGPYVIQQLIGEGGMGSVYRAEQRHPIHRVVALKLVKLGMDTREVIARFESERQALALMDHPNVAKVLDAGATDGGRPYFVMEYVKGEPITQYADRHMLPLRERLELFTQACEAVHHAHQKAIIHRDLKPSNILVTTANDRPQVKVIDFGVAKATAQRLTERTLFTETGRLVGTPEYMAPEQAESAVQDVDTRSDVYSLGVILYELLSGALPFDPKSLRGAGYDEIQRIIRETDPPRPSTRLSKLGKEAVEVARLRQTPLDALERQLKSELEWIPLKAMQKERARRYASATELAEDIGNYLASRPLRAAPDSAAYRLRKFLRRNRGGVAASAAIIFLLIAGIAATTWQAVRATRAEQQARAALRKAEDAADEVRAVNHFLTEDLLASAAPEVTRGREMTVREALDRAADAIAKQFPGRPKTEAAVRAVLADTYEALGQSSRALSHAQVALDLSRRAHGPDHELTLEGAARVGKELATLNRHAEAEPMLREARARAERLLGPDHLVTLKCVHQLAMTLRMQEKFGEAEPLYRRLLDARRRINGPRSDETARALNNLAVLLNTQGRSAEAEPLYREALDIRAAVLGEDHPAYLGSLANLARVLQNQGKLDETIALQRIALAGKRRVLGDDHPATTLTMNDLASVLDDIGQLEESEQLHREALKHRRQVLGDRAVDTLQSIHNLAGILRMREKYDEAEPLFREAIEGRRAVHGPTHAFTVNALSGLALVYEAQERWADAEPLLAELTRPGMIAATSPSNQAALYARRGFCLANLGRYAEAEAPARRALELLAAVKPEPPHARAMAVRALSDVCAHTNRPDEAAKFRAELDALRAATQAPATQAPATQAATRPGR